MNNIKFGFEDLDVWQKAVLFAQKVLKLTEYIGLHHKHFRLLDQLEASSTSVSMNIAEGKGRYSKKEFIQYLYIAKGSLNETITLITIFHLNKWITEEQLFDIKESAEQISKMISGLIASIRNSISDTANRYNK